MRAVNNRRKHTKLENNARLEKRTMNSSKNSFGAKPQRCSVFDNFEYYDTAHLAGIIFRTWRNNKWAGVER